MRSEGAGGRGGGEEEDEDEDEEEEKEKRKDEKTQEERSQLLGYARSQLSLGKQLATRAFQIKVLKYTRDLKEEKKEGKKKKRAK